MPARRLWPAWLIVALGWSLLFAPQIFQQRVFTGGDARVFRPFAEYSRERWITVHERAHWNAYVYAGIPSDASLADSRPQYLPDFALDWFERLRPSNLVPLGGPLLAYLAGMLAMAALARALWGCNVSGMAFAGLAWGLLPEMLSPFANGHDAQIVSCSLIPPILLAVHRVFEAEARRLVLGLLLLAILLGLFVLTGHPQVVVYGGMLMVGFAIERAFHFRRRARLAGIGGSVLVATLLSAAVWLPALFYSSMSFRGGGGMPSLSESEIARYSFAWRDLLGLVWPWAVGFGQSTYWGGLSGTDHPSFVGSVVLLLAISALLRRSDGEGTRKWFLFGVSAFALLSSLGPHLGIAWTALRAVVPLGSRFRSEYLWMSIAQLGVVLLAAREFSPRPEPPGVPRQVWLIGVIRLALGIVIMGPLAQTYAAYVEAARPGIPVAAALQIARHAGFDLAVRFEFPILGILLLWVGRSLSPRAPLARAALVALMCVGLGTISVPLLAEATGTKESLAAAPEPELGKIGAREPWTRVMSTRRVPSVPGQPILTFRDVEFYSNDWVHWRAHSLGGNHGALPALWRSAGDLTRSVAAQRALGVTYVSADPGAVWDPSLYERVYQSGGEVVYRLRGALSRAYTVGVVAKPGDDDVVIAAMGSPDFDPARLALTSDDRPVGVYPGSEGCRLSWVADDPDRVALSCDARDRAFLVLADTWFPGWKATLDGHEIPIYRVNHLVRGMMIPAGRHTIEMRYVPEGWEAGVRLTRAALAAWLTLVLGAWLWSATGGRTWDPRPGEQPAEVPGRRIA
ncbi:MAG: YfhO family protein [Candidatus Eiseniibacteriota bacterium]